MNSDQNKAKRWRPRWSVRVLLIATTLLCAYLASWGPTTAYGPRDLRSLRRINVWRGLEEEGRNRTDFRHAAAVLPLIVKVSDFEPGSTLRGDPLTIHSDYYLWFFGYAVKLPFQRRAMPQALDAEQSWEVWRQGDDRNPFLVKNCLSRQEADELWPPTKVESTADVLGKGKSQEMTEISDTDWRREYTELSS